MIKKIISGGQTGVDRAALDMAIKLKIPHGGWCPKGHLAEDGIIPGKYLLTETTTSDYSERTKLNVRDSDGTLVLFYKISLDASPGLKLTLEEAKKNQKPHQLIDLAETPGIDPIIEWIKKYSIHTLNIAGPRESQNPGIYQISSIWLAKLLATLT